MYLAPHFADRALGTIGRQHVEEFMVACRERGRSTKSTLNYLGFLRGIFDFALREGWVGANPCTLVDKTRAEGADPEIRYLDQAGVFHGNSIRHSQD